MALAPRRTAASTFGYDKNGNLTQRVDNNWNSLGGVPNKTTRQTFTSPSAAASSPASPSDANAYFNASSPNLRSQAVCRSVTGSGNGSVTEWVYDSHGNVTQENDWDSTRQAAQPGCGQTAQMNSGNAVVLSRGPYSSGDLTDSTDGNGNHTHYVYGTGYP